MIEEYKECSMITIYILIFLLGSLFGLIICYVTTNWDAVKSTVKVDYSIEAKKVGLDKCPQSRMYAIYTRNNFWDKWKEFQVYTSHHIAYQEASTINKMPEYF